MIYNPLKWKLHWQILASLILSALVALLLRISPESMGPASRFILGTCGLIGTLFMNGLKMVVVPLIVASIILGMLGIGSQQDFGRTGIKVLVYYTISGFLAIVVGLALVNIIQPGNIQLEDAQAIVGSASIPEDFIKHVEGNDPVTSLKNTLIKMVPSNVFEAAAKGQFLGLIFFSILFGFFICRLPEKQKQFQNDFWDSVHGVMMLITDVIIKLAPIGIFGLVTPVIHRAGMGAVESLIWFVVTVLSALLIHVFITLSFLLRGFGKVNPLRHLKTMSPVLLTAFSTASSASTLPVTMETVEKDAGVSNRISSFTLPLGATVNMDGTALYECVVVIFIAQLYGVTQGFDIGFGTQFMVLLMALFTSVGVAGIPHASLVAIAVILGAVGLPIEAVGVIWVVDRFLDMCRTSVNVYSDTCGAVIIGRTEGETGIYSD